MEQGANTTYVRYRVLRARGRLVLKLKVFVNYRDHHGSTRGGGWQMDVAPVKHGLRVAAFDGATPLLLLADGAETQVAHTWYQDFDLPGERERGLDAIVDHLHAGTFSVSLAPGEALTLVLSTESSPALDGEQAWERRAQHEEGLVVARRPTPADPDGMTVIAGYHWFGDWGRDTMIALPGLALATGRADIARRILTTFARFVDHGMLPNRFPDAGEAPEYNTVDATLWYFEAIRAYHAAIADDGLIKDVFAV